MGDQDAPTVFIMPPSQPEAADAIVVGADGAQCQVAELKDSAENEAPSVEVDFVTLGMFIIDDIEFLPPIPPARNVLGGAGAFSALGARIMSPPPTSSSVGWIVDMGTDFPPHLTSLIDSWETSCLLRPNPDRLTTRGWNGYTGVENRAFKYMTPKRRLTATDLTPSLLQSRSFHLICSPARCQELVADIRRLRKKVMPPDQYTKPLFIWEPVPDQCTPDQLLNCTNTLPVVDIVSPNHTELAGFMGDDGIDPETGEISTAAVERHCEQLLGSIPLQSFTLVVRAGAKGCYLARNGGRKRIPNGQGSGKKRRRREYVRGGLQHDTDMEALFAGLLQDAGGYIAREEIEVDPGVERWIPAYHHDPSKVVDPTGGGNCFLGGLGVALARGKGIEEAAVWASVAASFAIEQVGVPALGKDENGNETWNGARVEDRLQDFQERLAMGKGW